MNISPNISHKAQRKWNTPKILKLGMYCCWGGSLIFSIASYKLIAQQRDAIVTIGKDSAPSIINAQKLKDAIAGMNAFAANELITPSGQNLAAMQGYRERYERMSERLVLVAENITYGEKERQPITILQKGIGDYIAALQNAKDANIQGNTNLKLQAFRQASDLMDRTLLPAVNALKKANLDELEKSYQTQKIMHGRSMFIIFTLGIFVLALLITLQTFLSQRTKRTFNLGLLAATAIAGGFLFYTLSILNSSSQALKIAKEDAFDSIDPLREIRSLFYGILSDESRYLLDPALAKQYEQAFKQKSSHIANLSLEQFPLVTAAVKQNRPFHPFSGLLANEIKNITFLGERAAVAETLGRLGDYLGIDAHIRQLEKTGKHSEAVALIDRQISLFHLRLQQLSAKSPNAAVCANSKTPDCFLTQFMDANLKTYAINKNYFYRGLDKALQAVGGYKVNLPPDKNLEQLGEIEPKNLDEFVLIDILATTAICLLILYGLLSRFREYEA